MIKQAEQWLLARVLVEIHGDGEAFLQAAAWEKLPLGAVRREGELLLVWLCTEDLGKLRRALRLSHCHMHVRQRQGLPFLLAFLRRRPLLPLAAALLVAALCLVSSLIFRVEVSSVEPLPRADRQRILAVAEEQGLRPGRFIQQVDLEHCQRQIELDFPELFFVEISRRGVDVEIRVAKRIDISPAQQKKAPGDIIALRDGVIQDILVRKGTAAVAVGDTVVKGQVLIYGQQGRAASNEQPGQSGQSGQEESPAATEPVAADGLVYARVWATGYGECPRERQELRPSGQQQVFLQLRGKNGARLTLAGDEEAYAYSDRQLKSAALLPWRNTGDTVEVIHGEIGEMLPVSIQHTYEEALAIAAREAELQAKAELLHSCNIGDTGILQLSQEELPLEPELARVRVTLEALSQIGLYDEQPPEDR